uniref:Extracellular solute-binding protein family 3 n=1 Tax=Cyanothece sp. (strain PCC 7425 / ATCC 29141) TaxID=395961 RepID=B8HPX9_CYAP4
MKRRKFLTKAGQTAGVILVAGGLKSMLVSCAGNVSNPNDGSPQGSQVPSTGLMSAGTLQWGAESSGGAPYVFYAPDNPGQLIGFEVEIADAIAKLMGVKATLVQTTYSQLAAALGASKFDMIMNGWEISTDREQTQIFSEPYYRYGLQIVVRTDDPRFKDINDNSDFTIKNLAGMTVGTGAGYKAEEILRSDSKITTKAYEGTGYLDDLRLKRVDAAFIDLPIVAYYVLGSGPGGTADPALKLAGKPDFLNNYVIAFRKTDPKGATLQGEINQALAILKKDGTLKSIYERWKMWNDQQAEIGIT